MTTPRSRQRAIGLFPSRPQAEAAMYQLRDSNFDMDRVSIVANQEAGTEPIAGQTVHSDKADQVLGGAGAGAVAGSTTGGMMGLIGSLGVLAIPGVGLAAEVGIILASTLLGGGIGAAGGSIVGALVGMGVPEERAAYYNERVYSRGEYLLVLEGSEQELQQAQTITSGHGLRDWEIYGVSE